MKNIRGALGIVGTPFKNIINDIYVNLSPKDVLNSLKTHEKGSAR